MNKDEIIVMMIALMIVAVAFGSIISYNDGYQRGINYQKNQQVLINIQTYTDNGMSHYNSTADITGENFLVLWPEYVPNFTCYKITRYKGV